MKPFSLLTAGILVSLFIVPPAFAQRSEIEKRLKTWTPYIDPEPGRVYSDTYAEYSPVRIAGRRTHWEQYSTRLMARVGQHLPYAEFNLFERDRRKDEALVLGSNLIFKDWNLQPEIGFGMDTDYMYRFQTGVRYERRLKGPLYGKLGERYLHYRVGDVFSSSPGLIYYFGNHYLSADYLASVTEARGAAHAASIRGDLVFFQHLHLYSGMAAGQRIFDIAPLDASKQEGWLFFTGIDYRILEQVKIGFDYSYGEERRPEFIKQGFGGRISIRF